MGKIKYSCSCSGGGGQCDNVSEVDPEPGVNFNGIRVRAPQSDLERTIVEVAEEWLSVSQEARAAALCAGAATEPIAPLRLLLCIAAAQASIGVSLKGQAMLERARNAFYRSLFTSVEAKEIIKHRWREWLAEHPGVAALAQAPRIFRAETVRMAVEDDRPITIADAVLVAAHEGQAPIVLDGDGKSFHCLEYSFAEGVIESTLDLEQIRERMVLQASQVMAEMKEEVRRLKPRQQEAPVGSLKTDDNLDWVLDQKK